jgi:TRAP-type mannitol/chloroaromatic compound transport system permease small subunit
MKSGNSFIEKIRYQKKERLEGIVLEGYWKFVNAIDKFSDVTGRIFSYMVYPLVGCVAYEVFARYLFDAPTAWAYDITYMFYGSIFMLGAAYTLLKKGHIRTDLFYNNWTPQRQGKIDALSYLFFFFPGMIFYLISGIDYAAHSWITNEKSSNSPWMPIIYPFKTVIPVAAILLLIQGVSEFLKSLHAWKKGEWK